MRFFPNSYGSPRSAGTQPRRVREFNPCHDPKNGLFAPKGNGDCEEGPWDAPGRQRAIYGQEVPDDGALDLDRDEVKKAQEFIDDGPASRQDAKASIAAELGEKIAGHEGFDAFYQEFKGKIGDAPGENGEGWATGDYDWEDDPLGLKDAYESEYESYKDGEIEEQDNSFYEIQRDEYDKDRDKAIDAVTEAVGKMSELWDEVQAENPYGDTSKNLSLPGMEDVKGGKELDDIAYLKATLLGEEFKDRRRNGSEWEREMGDIDWDDPDFRAEVKAELREYSRSRLGDKWPGDLAKEFLSEHSDFFQNPETSKYGDDGFDIWRDYEGGSPDYEYKDFQDWYVHEHGDPEYEAPDGDEDTEYGQGDTRAERAASWMIHQWANTSGDGSPDSVMLQAAANKEFKLGATFTGVFQNRGANLGEVDSRLKRHGPFLQSFLRNMYDNTQEKLKKAGIDYVTLYRGFNLHPSTEKGLSTVRKDGEFVDVLMQPMSSFSSSYNTALGFSGYSAETSVMMGVRVPRERVIGSARTGFGALTEQEFVVLGGRQPAFIYAPYAGENARMAGSFTAETGFWDSFKRTQRRRKSASTSGGVVIGPGDRL